MLDHESPLATIGLSKSDKELKEAEKIDANEEVHVQCIVCYCMCCVSLCYHYRVCVHVHAYIHVIYSIFPSLSFPLCSESMWRNWTAHSHLNGKYTYIITK